MARAGLGALWRGLDRRRVNRMGLGLSCQEPAKDQFPRRRVISRVSRTVRIDERQGPEATEGQLGDGIGTIPESSGDAGH